jgi:hypothetical protein
MVTFTDLGRPGDLFVGDFVTLLPETRFLIRSEVTIGLEEFLDLRGDGEGFTDFGDAFAFAFRIAAIFSFFVYKECKLPNRFPEEI